MYRPAAAHACEARQRAYREAGQRVRYFHFTDCSAFAFGYATLRDRYAGRFLFRGAGRDRGQVGLDLAPPLHQLEIALQAQKEPSETPK